MNRIRAHAVEVLGDGPTTVVLGHGIGGGPDHWRTIAPRLAEHYRVVTFALAGHADADPALFVASRHASILGFADDLALLCADLDIRGAHYVGHSMSAMAGALASVGDPGLFDRLVLINMSASYVDHPRDAYRGGFTEEQVNQLLDDLAADYSLWAAGFGPYVMGNTDKPELGQEFAASLASLGPEIALVVFRAAFLSDFREYLSRIRVPTLLLQSGQDPAVPAEVATWMSGQIPDAQLLHLRSTGHFPHVADPEEVLAAIEPFLAD